MCFNNLVERIYEFIKSALGETTEEFAVDWAETMRLTPKQRKDKQLAEQQRKERDNEHRQIAIYLAKNGYIANEQGD